MKWINDNLTGRPPYVRLGATDSETSSTGAPQGTVLSLVLFTPYMSDFQHRSLRMIPRFQEEQEAAKACSHQRRLS